MWLVTLNTIFVYTHSPESCSKIHKTYSSNSEQPSWDTARLCLIHAQPNYHYIGTSLWISIPIFWAPKSSTQVLREFHGGMWFWSAWIGLIFGNPNFTIHFCHTHFWKLVVSNKRSNWYQFWFISGIWRRVITYSIQELQLVLQPVLHLAEEDFIRQLSTQKPSMWVRAHWLLAVVLPCWVKFSASINL
jgi:hypothetical protein